MFSESGYRCCYRTLVRRLTLKKGEFVSVASADSLFQARSFWSECSKSHFCLISAQWSSVIWIIIHSEALPLIHTWTTPGCGESAWSPSTCCQTRRSPCLSTSTCRGKSKLLCIFLADVCSCYTTTLAINGSTPFVDGMLWTAGCVALSENFPQSFFLGGRRPS